MWARLVGGRTLYFLMPVRLPVREDINDMPIEEHLIVELYSK